MPQNPDFTWRLSFFSHTGEVAWFQITSCSFYEDAFWFCTIPVYDVKRRKSGDDDAFSLLKDGQTKL